MGKKDEIIHEQDKEIQFLNERILSLSYNLDVLNRQYNTAILSRTPTTEAPKPRKRLIKNYRWWNFSVELWPGAWDLSYYRYDWKRAQANGHPGLAREGNIHVGPFAFSWNREPK